jgi:hypothetical protein
MKYLAVALLVSFGSLAFFAQDCDTNRACSDKANTQAEMTA